MPEAKTRSGGRRYLIGFSITGSLLIILFFAFINFTTGARFPWSIFPSYAVLFWPLTAIFAGRHSMKIFSLIGSLLTIAVLFILNYLTSWGYPWFLYPSFAILWWPVALFFGANHAKTFSIAGSIVIIAAMIVTNLIASPSNIWFYYPVFAVVWWPLSVLFATPRTIMGYSIAGAAIIITFLTLTNYLESPSCPWAPLTYFPALMWPLGVLLGRRWGTLRAALWGCLAGMLYYAAMNIWLFPGFPWAIFPVYALLWWPLAVAFAKREHSLLFSVAGSLLSAAFFIAVNIIASPETIWAVYPIFALVWWPLSVYCFSCRSRKINAETI